MSWGVGHRCGSDLALLWLWCRPVATAPIQLLAWEPPHAAGAAPQKQKTNKQNQPTKQKMQLATKGHNSFIGFHHWESLESRLWDRELWASRFFGTRSWETHGRSGEMGQPVEAADKEVMAEQVATVSNWGPTLWGDLERQCQVILPGGWKEARRFIHHLPSIIGGALLVVD